ncbi:hypothetical protein Leryth_026411 [Lithospermum erythrorhizon]|nr:hypothetical protein Leryth_026411 [Lithospermum erythrorhizon]
MALALGERAFFLLVVILTANSMLPLSYASLPAVFIFGDSTVDVGTNNYLNGTATATDRFYGIDYPYSMPTGRFSNGLNTADFIVSLLGDSRESPPPYLALANNMAGFKSKILRGVNFASGGSGILEDTGNKTWKAVVSLRNQIDQFAIVQENILEVLGKAKGEHLVANSLYIISSGSNDFVEFTQNNPFVSSTTIMSDVQSNFTKHLKTLYSLGARKFAIVSVPAIGCIPAVRAKVGGSCVDDLNNSSRVFYSSMTKILDNFSSTSEGFLYSIGNTYLMTMSIIDNARANGFREAINACCGTGDFNGGDKCTPTSNLCKNRDEYLFWDWFHPTQRASSLAALTLVFAEGKEFVTPINFSQLASKEV